MHDAGGPYPAFFLERSIIMKAIPLTRGKVALVDDIDFDRLNKHKWHAQKGRNTWYAVRNTYHNCICTTIQMHREILGLGYGDPRQCDHRNHNGLNNQRDNLRICTRSQNQYNQRPQSGKSSIYKGVSWCKREKKWRSYIHIKRHRISLSYFDSEIEAAKAYDQKAIELFGKFAHINLEGE